MPRDGSERVNRTLMGPYSPKRYLFNSEIIFTPFFPRPFPCLSLIYSKPGLEQQPFSSRSGEISNPRVRLNVAVPAASVALSPGTEERHPFNG